MNTDIETTKEILAEDRLTSLKCIAEDSNLTVDQVVTYAIAYCIYRYDINQSDLVKAAIAWTEKNEARYI